MHKKYGLEGFDKFAGMSVLSYVPEFQNTFHHSQTEEQNQRGWYGTPRNLNEIGWCREIRAQLLLTHIYEHRSSPTLSHVDVSQRHEPRLGRAAIYSMRPQSLSFSGLEMVASMDKMGILSVEFIHVETTPSLDSNTSPGKQSARIE